MRNTLFISLANEGAPPDPMGEDFEQLRRTLAAQTPKGLTWKSERFLDEDHSSTELRAHYAALRVIFEAGKFREMRKPGCEGEG